MSTNPNSIIKVKPPLRSEIYTVRFLICCGIISMFIFLKWFIDPDHIGYAPVFWLLTFALAFKLTKMLHEWYSYWSPSVPTMPISSKKYTVDVLTTACPGEPQEMIINTLRAMKAIHYPHTNYLCDEGNDPVLKRVCDELGIIHVTRIDKKDAKAGNINNALQQATGEICLVLDPDHVPIPEFLDRVLPYFENEKIGFVQCVQAYKNQSESFVALGAAEQTYHFYGPMMMCMNSYGTVQAIGANCTFRRKALDSIGGHAAGLAEDMHTAMQLHAKGWESIYVPEILTRGLVPATLSSYYKQQLKWSRGTFELLFRTFPDLYKNFTWRQKLHYLTIPLYFLFGLINLIDIAVPVLALSFAQVPWEVSLVYFGVYFLPVCSLSLIIRLYSQRWLLEKHERGFHLAGGILRTATWWIFLIGFVYTIFKIKVPYIPTPKEDEHQNYIKLSIPNILVLLTCVGLVSYGLYIDWTPYSIAMAFYSLLTVSILGFTAIMSQQKLLIQVKEFCNKMLFFKLTSNFLSNLSNYLQHLIYNVVRKGAFILIIVLSFIFVSSVNSIDEIDQDHLTSTKELGGFYLGTQLSGDKHDLNEINLIEKQVGSSFNLIGFSQNWKEGTDNVADLMDGIRIRGSLPYLTWNADRLSDTLEGNVSENICNAKYDNYLKNFAAILRNYKDPIFIDLNISETTNSPQEFIKAWQYVYTFFNDLGISNITWVWSPNTIKEENFYPGEKFVDWIGVNCLNYGQMNSKDHYSFSELYAPYRNCFGKLKKPIIISNFGTPSSAEQLTWYTNAFHDIENKFKEIRSVVLYNGHQQMTFINGNDTSKYNFDFGLSNSDLNITEQLKDEFFKKQIFAKNLNSPKATCKSNFVKGTPGHFELLVKGQPYYIRGVAYNTAHDWRDGNMPLTRRQVEKDFKLIKEMGANTIRRYGTGIYDRNVLNIAKEYDMNVLYGFWFDPKIDFYKDSAKVLAYLKEVEEKVIQFKDQPAIIGWSLGNESWGLLKHTYAKPYLTKVRNSYIQFIEQLAQMIHKLDPTRPVFSCIEHEEYQLPGELVAFHDGAPSIDVIGINSYYKEQISKLNHLAWQFDSLRPYLVSEFGPRGYWNPKYNKTVSNSIIEETDSEKSDWYKKQWVSFVNGNKGYNVGGFAYCWHDRMEGTYTWFGLTDFKGRVKPAYFALKEQWTNIKQENFPQFDIKCPTTLIAGNTYSFSAVPNASVKTDLHYEWRLLKDEYLDKVNAIEISDDGSCISLTVPKEPSDYRLYLFVVDENNEKVTTASVPIKVNSKAIR